jgi:hypothetical protein
MKISELKNGQTVRYRIGLSVEHLHGEGSGGGIRWEAWKEGSLYVQARERAYRKFKAGVVCLAVPEREVSAEHDYQPPSEGMPNGYFMTEEYCLEIAGIEPGWEF